MGKQFRLLVQWNLYLNTVATHTQTDVVCAHKPIVKTNLSLMVFCSLSPLLDKIIFQIPSVSFTTAA